MKYSKKKLITIWKKKHTKTYHKSYITRLSLCNSLYCMPSLKNIYFIKRKSRYVYGGTQKFKRINKIQNQFIKSVINSETFLMQTPQSTVILQRCYCWCLVKKSAYSGCKENHFYSLPFGQAECNIY